MRFFKKINFRYLVVSLVFVLLTLNYTGFCFKEMRYLSEDEKINIVIKYVLDDYPGSKSWDSYSSAWPALWPKNPVPYQDIKEFRKLNPDCCVVTRDYISLGGEGDNTSFWGCLTGQKSSIVGVRYWLRYRDEHGIVQSQKKEIFLGMSNCGVTTTDLG